MRKRNFNAKTQRRRGAVTRKTADTNSHELSRILISQKQTKGTKRAETESFEHRIMGTGVLSLTPWLQPGDRRRRTTANRFNGLPPFAQAVETASISCALSRKSSVRSAIFIAARPPHVPFKLRRSGMKWQTTPMLFRFSRVTDMPLLRSLAGSNGVVSYKHGAPNGAWLRRTMLDETVVLTSEEARSRFEIWS